MKHRVPTVNTLLTLLPNVTVKIVERASVPVYGEDGAVVRRQTVRGYCEKESFLIVVGKRFHRNWARADDLCLTLLHELLHIAVPHASERWVRAHEMQLYKEPTLREAAAIRLLNVALFPESSQEV